MRALAILSIITFAVGAPHLARAAPPLSTSRALDASERDIQFRAAVTRIDDGQCADSDAGGCSAAWFPGAGGAVRLGSESGLEFGATITVPTEVLVDVRADLFRAGFFALGVDAAAGFSLLSFAAEVPASVTPSLVAGIRLGRLDLHALGGPNLAGLVVGEGVQWEAAAGLRAGARPGLAFQTIVRHVWEATALEDGSLDTVEAGVSWVF